MPAKKKSYPDISIGGRNLKHSDFKIHELEEDEIPRLLRSIESSAKHVRESVNATSKDIKEIMSFTPLFHVEFLIRAQLNLLLEGKHLTNEELKTPSDLLQEEERIRYMGCIKTSFLFLFLKDIVSMNDDPSGIDQRTLDKFESNLRGLFFLIGPQTDGAKSKKYKDPAFKPFAHIIWRKSKVKKLTAHYFWACVLKELRKPPYQAKLRIPRYSARSPNANKKDIFVFTLDKDKRNEPVIKITCESSDNLNITLITRSQVTRNWPKIQKEFIRNKNKNDR